MNGQLNGQQRRSTGDATVNGSIYTSEEGGKWFFEDFDENED